MYFHTGKADDLTKYKRLNHKEDGTFSAAVTTSSKNVYNASFHDLERREDLDNVEKLVPSPVSDSSCS